MRLNTLTIMTSILFSFSLLAQKNSEDFELTWSKSVDNKSAIHFEGAKKIKDGYLIFDKETIRGPGGYRYFIEIYNNDMEFEKKVDISEQIDERNYTILEVLNYGDNFLLITSRVFKKEKREEIYIQKIGEDGERLVGERIKIHEETYYNRKEKSTYRLSVSPNAKQLLLQIIPSLRRREVQNLSLVLLDNELIIQWDEEDVMLEGDGSAEKDGISIINIVINDFGDVYFLGKEFKKRSSFDILTSRNRMSLRGNDDVYNQIFKLVEGKFVENITLTRDGLRGMDIQLGKDNRLHCVGYYTDDPKGKGIKGVASYTIDKDLSEIRTENLLLFDDEFHLVGLEGRALDKATRKLDKDKEVNNFKDLVTEEVIQHEDGSLTLIGEIQYVYTYTTSGVNGSTTHTNYVYGNLVLSRINPDGEVLSNTIIRKSNTYSRPTPVHNLMFPINHHFVRIALKNRGDFLDPDPDKGAKDRLLAVRIVNEEGEHSEDVLFDYTDKPEHRGDRIPNVGLNGVLLSNNDVIILTTQGRNEHKFIRISPLNQN